MKNPEKIDSKIPDVAVRDWLSGSDGEAIELIVEAKLPRRTVSFRKERGKRPVPSGIKSDSGDDRLCALEDLSAYLMKLLNSSPTMLKAAGAIAVRANREQVQQFITHPLVKAVRSNRPLRR